MKAKIKFEPTPKNFWEFYTSAIKPKLMEIDLLLRCAEETVSVSETACALAVSSDEVKTIMAQNNISAIDSSNFLVIMKNGSSGICKLYQRETECGSPYTYTREEISYIYDLDIDTVNSACDRLGIKEATAFTLPKLFSQISLP
ncbi:MAG: hypothetical protein LBU77_05560 [Clostridiales bacterium]|jgi:hypothetical protein|nr:hypothetical protein [Clostridiales bacterium]